jgi:hypothetical protein
MEKPNPIGIFEEGWNAGMRKISLKPLVAESSFINDSFIGLYWPYEPGQYNDLPGRLYARNVNHPNKAAANRIMLAIYVDQDTDTNPATHIVDLYRYLLATEFTANEVYRLTDLETWALDRYGPYLSLYSLGEREIDIRLNAQTFFNTELIKSLAAWSEQLGLDLQLPYADILKTRTQEVST